MEEKGKLAQWSKHFNHLAAMTSGAQKTSIAMCSWAHANGIGIHVCLLWLEKKKNQKKNKCLSSEVLGKLALYLSQRRTIPVFNYIPVPTSLFTYKFWLYILARSYNTIYNGSIIFLLIH